ncbi:unnamed protein product [Heterosigma akashiwo]
MSHIGSIRSFHRAVEDYSTKFLIELCVLSFEYDIRDLQQPYFMALKTRITDHSVVEILAVSLKCQCIWLSVECWRLLEKTFWRMNFLSSDVDVVGSHKNFSSSGTQQTFSHERKHSISNVARRKKLQTTIDCLCKFLEVILLLRINSDEIQEEQLFEEG